MNGKLYVQDPRQILIQYSGKCSDGACTMHACICRKKILEIWAKKCLLSKLELGPQTGEFGVSSTIVLLCDGRDSGRTWGFSCRRVSIETFSVLWWQRLAEGSGHCKVDCGSVFLRLSCCSLSGSLCAPLGIVTHAEYRDELEVLESRKTRTSAQIEYIPLSPRAFCDVITNRTNTRAVVVENNNTTNALGVARRSQR
jgi:hypothetical protein